MLRILIRIGTLLLPVTLIGCGSHASSKGPEGGLGGSAGLTARATNPSGLVADPLIVPGSSEVALTALYGSPLVYLGYVPMALTKGNSWFRSQGTIPAGRNSVQIDFTPDGKIAYVVNLADYTVTVLDTATGATITTIPVGRRPNSVAIAPDGTVAYVTNNHDDTVSVIDVSTHTLLGDPIAVGDEPHAVDFTPDSTRAFVANGDDTVSVIDVAAQSVESTLNVSGANQVAVTPDGSELYITSSGLISDAVLVYDPDTLQKLDTINIDNPDTVAFTPDGDLAFVDRDDWVTVIHTETRTVVTDIDVTVTGKTEENGEQVAVSADGTTAYCTVFNTNAVERDAHKRPRGPPAWKRLPGLR